jgi:hypothetical protein
MTVQQTKTRFPENGKNKDELACTIFSDHSGWKKRRKRKAERKVKEDIRKLHRNCMRKADIEGGGVGRRREKGTNKLSFCILDLFGSGLTSC